MDSKLIIVEGLTGSGKSIMAHFLARQLQHNGIPAGWIHEGEVPHPILRDVESSIESYMAEMRLNWKTYVDEIDRSKQVRVVEACFFNNLIETLFMHNLGRSKIIQYGEELQMLIEPLNPTLVYLVQADLEQALERNFKNRGDGFRDFVIQLTTGTPFGKQRDLQGYEGMVTFWREFVDLMDELFQGFHIRKLRIDNSAGNWDDDNHQVLEFLSIPLKVEQGVTTGEASHLVGAYKDRRSDKEFAVRYEAGELTINFFLNVNTRLVRQTEKTFLAEGWHFVISFELDDSSRATALRIDGRDIDYLALVGTVADKVST